MEQSHIAPNYQATKIIQVGGKRKRKPFFVILKTYVTKTTGNHRGCPSI